MGMFNHIKIDNLGILPMSEEELASLDKDHLFQTKEFECLLDLYVLIGDKLLKEECEWYEVPREERPYPDDDGFLGLAGSMGKRNCEMIDTHFHGIFNFYTYTDTKTWLEFDAKFTDGKLVEINRLKEEEEMIDESEEPPYSPES